MQGWYRLTKIGKKTEGQRPFYNIYGVCNASLPRLTLVLFSIIPNSKSSFHFSICKTPNNWAVYPSLMISCFLSNCHVNRVQPSMWTWIILKPKYGKHAHPKVVTTPKKCLTHHYGGMLPMLRPDIFFLRYNRVDQWVREPVMFLDFEDSYRIHPACELVCWYFGTHYCVPTFQDKNHEVSFGCYVDFSSLVFCFAVVKNGGWASSKCSNPVFSHFLPTSHKFISGFAHNYTHTQIFIKLLILDFLQRYRLKGLKH